MLASQIGYYSLVIGLFFSILIIPISIRNLNDTKIINIKIFQISFLQLMFALISFGGLIISFVIELMFIIKIIYIFHVYII